METKKLKARGRSLLKISGLLMVIAGGISIIIAIIVLVLVGIITGSIEDTDFATEIFSGIASLAAIVVIVGSAVQIITGIVGLKNAGVPEHYRRCKVWGIIVLVLESIGIILDLIGAIIFGVASSELGIEGFSYPWYSIIVSVICGVIIPVIFIVGAGLNKQSFLEGVTSKDLPMSRLERKKAQKIAEQLKADDALKVKNTFEKIDEIEETNTKTAEINEFSFNDSVDKDIASEISKSDTANDLPDNVFKVENPAETDLKSEDINR